MADHHHLPPLPSETLNRTPLLNVTEQVLGEKQEYPEEEDCETQLDRDLKKLESFLALLGFSQSSAWSFGLSWVVFLGIGVALPVVVLELFDCSGCAEYQIKSFELDVVVSQACLAAVSLFCLSHNLRKYGIRKFLFVDRYSGQMSRFRDDYIQKIKDYVLLYLTSMECARLLVLWMLPCFILKTLREVARILFETPASWWQSVAVLLALIISWICVTAIYLSACVLFHLVCNLQIIHFDDYAKSLERESDLMLLIKEHIRLRYYLSKISHRFRIYLLLVFLVVSASQVVTLFQTTGYGGSITFINAGDFAVSSLVQVVGISLCLTAAAKISHRAQGIGLLASKWQALVTCSSANASQLRVSHSVGELETANALSSLYMDNSESDLESLDYIELPANTQLASHMSSYHKRQAFVMYLQTNPGGITLFGWTVDRGLINTIFFIELSLVLFVLGKTVVLAS